jgi:hypothetical protein
MKRWVLVCLVAITALGGAQEKATIGDFTKSPTENIINQIEQPFVVRSVAGIINRKQGDQGPLPDVLFEIQGPGTDRKIRRSKTDQRGRFKMGHVPDGSYKFKATLNGFQSLMGTITVSKQAPKTDKIEIAMTVGV